MVAVSTSKFRYDQKLERTSWNPIILSKKIGCAMRRELERRVSRLMPLSALLLSKHAFGSIVRGLALGQTSLRQLLKLDA